VGVVVDERHAASLAAECKRLATPVNRARARFAASIGTPSAVAAVSAPAAFNALWTPATGTLKSEKIA